jgi:hypothetical protein
MNNCEHIVAFFKLCYTNAEINSKEEWGIMDKEALKLSEKFKSKVEKIFEMKEILSQEELMNRVQTLGEQFIRDTKKLYIEKMDNCSDDISFRKLQESDFETLHKWLNTDFVTEWYEKGNLS